MDLLTPGAPLNTNSDSTYNKFAWFILAHDLICDHVRNRDVPLIVFPHTWTAPMACLQYVIRHNRFSLLGNCDTVAFMDNPVILRLQSDLLHSKL